jgi:hypothetical protein
LRVRCFFKVGIFDYLVDELGIVMEDRLARRIFALGIEGESPQAGATKSSLPRTCTAKPEKAPRKRNKV